MNAWLRGVLVVAGAILASTLLSQTHLFRSLDHRLADSQQRIVAAEYHAPDALILDIDETSLTRLRRHIGVWPYPRDVYGMVAGYLKDQGARTVVLDILFSDPRPGDDRLAHAIRQAGNVVLAATPVNHALEARPGQQAQLNALGWDAPANLPVARWQDILLPQPQIAAPLNQQSGVGVIRVPLDDDGTLRRVPLFHEIRKIRLPCIALAALFADVPPPAVRYDAAAGAIRVGAFSWPVNRDGEAVLYYPRNRDFIPVIPFSDVALAALGAIEIDSDASMFKGKTIFIGSSAAMLGDHAGTPDGAMAGLNLLGLIYENLAHGLVLKPPRWQWNAVLLALGVCFPLLACYRRFQSGLSIALLNAAGMLAAYAAALAMLYFMKQQSALLFTLLTLLLIALAQASWRVLDLRREREQLACGKQAAEESSRLKSQFLSHITHELRTPLTAILGFNQLLSDPQTLPSEKQKYVRIVQQNGEHLLTLINNLLDQAKLDAGQMVIEPAPVSIREIVNETIETLTTIAAPKELEFGATYDAGLPSCLLLDRLRLRQILMNIVGNAVKFTQQGYVHVAAAWSDGWLEIEVSDSGPGIARHALGKIFEPFHQAGISGGGTGLGLTVSRNLAHLMGGDITAESNPGLGSLFRVRLPAAAAEPHHASAVAETPAPTFSGPVRHALIVDDSDDIRALLAIYLERAGIKVSSAADGQEAVEIALAQPPDVILMDVDMPVMDGRAAVRALRSAGYAGPVFALTGHPAGEAGADLIAAGYTDCIQKPFRPEDLQKTMAAFPAPTRPPIPADEGLGKLIPAYLENQRKHLATARSALERGDYETLYLIGHNMKGTGKSYGLESISKLGARLEAAAKSRDRDAATALLEAISAVTSRTG